MKSYSKTVFASGSLGLDSLVRKVQNMPKDSITTKVKTGGAPQSDVPDRCLDAIARISNIADDSPGGSYKTEALRICWAVYQWIQEWQMENPVVSRNYSGPGMVSYNTLEDVDKL